MANSFITSAKKAMSEQNKIERKKVEDVDSLTVINIRIPTQLHTAAQFHRIRTGENMTQLIRRLLKEELGDND